MRIALVTLLALAVAPFGCAATSVTGEEEDDGDVAEIDEAVGTALPKPADPDKRLYWGSIAQDWVSDTAPLASWTFGARGGNRDFDLVVRAKTNDGRVDSKASIGFKVYRLGTRYGEKVWRLVKVVDGKNGVATFRGSSWYTRTYLVTATRSGVSGSLDLGLTCTDERGDCALAAQPGEGCTSGGTAKCDLGLFCEYKLSACGGKGVCTQPPKFCATIHSPVCGCDGKQYSNACTARSAKVSVANPGSCKCDSTKWTNGTVSNAALSAERWRSEDQSWYYSFKSDGTASILFEPECLRGDPPCKVATRLYTGTWSSSGSTVTLVYDHDAHKAVFNVETNCEKWVRLVGDDHGSTRLLTGEP